MGLSDEASHSLVGVIRMPDQAQSPGRAILKRVVGAMAALLLAVLIVYLDRDGYRDVNEDGVSLLVPVEADEGEMLSEAEPRTFSMAGQSGGCPLLRIHLAFVAEASLRRILEQTWRDRAPKRVQRS